ncbi:glycosyltransferase [Planococcus rifietoensis]|uniref:glycosyltransferase n=1 Tax=Planococcus rifietoensis TaxID=200991 RepID=UPI003850DE65
MSEINYFESQGIEVEIVPTELMDKDLVIRSNYNKQYPIKKIEKKMNKISRSKYLLQSLFQYSTWQEIYFQYKRNKLNFKSFYRIIGFISRGNYILENLKILYAADLKSSNKEKVLFYSYWNLESAYAISKLKESKRISAISRAHGVDIYEYRRRANIELLPMKNFILNKLDRIFTISKDGKEYLLHQFGDFSNVRISYLGTEDFGFKDFSLSHTPFKIVSCSRLTPIKNVNYLIDVLKEIKDVDILWTHFGDGPERETIEEKVENLPRNIRVNIRGDLSHEEVIKSYQNEDYHLFINTSISEGVPVSIMEAISFGIPVLATKVGGTKEIIKDSINGYCIPSSSSPKEFAKYIASIYELDKSHYSNLRKNTRKYWEHNFSYEKNYEKFIDEIKSIGEN